MTPDHSDTATRVLLAVLRQSRPTVRSVAFEVGRSVNATHKQLCKLKAAGLVTWEDDKAATLRPLVHIVERTGVRNYTEGTAHMSEAGDALEPHPGLVSGPSLDQRRAAVPDSISRLRIVRGHDAS